MFQPLGRILVLWLPQFWWLLIGALLSLAALAAGVGLMAFAGVTVSAAIVSGALLAPLILRWIGGFRVVSRYLERLVTHGATFRALADIRVWFFRGLARTAAGGLGFRQAGDVLGRLVSDVEALDGLYLRIILPLAGAVLLLPVLVILIGHHAPALALEIGLLFALAAFVLPWMAARASADAGAALARATGALRIAALDALTGLREVRAFAAEGRMLANVQAQEAAMLSAQRGMNTRISLAGTASFLCAQAAVLAVLLAAGTDPAGAIAAAFLVIAAFEAVGMLPRAGAAAGHAAAAAARVLEAADSPMPVAEPVDPVAMPKGNSLRFEAVQFRWQPDRPPVFDGLTLEVPEGARVALLGPSGAGKSTLAALVLKVAAPRSGQIRLGGVDIASLPAAALRARIGWLSQATHLFDDTIRANLLLADPTADDAALWAALDAARIGDVVRALPDGLDTWVGEGGTRFSGGQGRRLALARTLLSDAPILILDEPAAGLDAETERAFLETLNETTAGRTVILIIHRLTGVEKLDRIFRLSGGKAISAAG
ncbi:thiol reductant ABC exporter subunit CydC [Rhodopila sp.]|jgi:ATP-binding cassette subfamily C protein CydC|uniref:thiol reductant ABC exporter subunit CydC n=1 Tax=Rhodopila sp. TaxID=2480087 RepID=UPI002B9F4712|nr:thiol reductant ABC exporter subunit CydC [Rhodopila sp.]HVZ09173.1 thiol reductant ABC exporter subunit CydC [Rhodopila sp.]